METYHIGKGTLLKTLILWLLVVGLFLQPFIVFSCALHALTLEECHCQQVIVLPEEFTIGDFLFIESIPTWSNFYESWDHIAMYIGDNLFIETNDYSSIPYPIGKQKGVQITPLWKYGFWAQYYAFGLLQNVTMDQRRAAVDWALAQQQDGNFQASWKNYSWWANPNPHDTSDPNAGNWYCSEFPWAAYYNTSNGIINLDATPGPRPFPMGDGIHLSVKAQDIADHENVVIYAEEGAPSPPSTPKGDLTMVTLPQCGVYTTELPDESNQGLFYQWAWGDNFHPEQWEFLPAVCDTTISASHLWKKTNIHDLRDHNFYYDVRVRCKDVFGRVSAWSQPLGVHVAPNFLHTEWVSPTGHVDTGWIHEKHAYDNHSILTSSSITFNENEWCPEPLVLTLDEPLPIQGFRIRATHPFIYDTMQVCLYNGTDHLFTFNYTKWPHLRWNIINLHEYDYLVDRVELWIHKNHVLSTFSLIQAPFQVCEFSFWKTDSYGKYSM